ncbi:MAG: hypothetical protein JWQ38_2247 [Flavipsychrobacter sp.]|nr:hypothetical protein [Flavipsychrobacter sp.]
MVHTKGNGQNGLNDDRRKNQGDNRQADKTPNRGLEEQTRESARKPGKQGQDLKGSPGKNNNR